MAGRVRILRHRREAAGGLSTGNPELVAAVTAHVSNHFSPPATVWHELVSSHVHVDVHVVAPSSSWPVQTLVTSGMSERPMPGPDGLRWAELMMMLPHDWPAPETDAFRQESVFWPYRLLQDLAHFPHRYETAVWAGHTIPNGDPPEPYAPGARFCGSLLVHPLIAPKGFKTMTLADREVQFLAVLPLLADELALRVNHGLSELYDLLDEADVTEIFDPARPSVLTT